MHCPFCRFPDSRVIDSRTSDDGLSIRRRRQCPECGRLYWDGSHVRRMRAALERVLPGWGGPQRTTG